MSTTEKAFEDAIELKLLSHGSYFLSLPGDFDRSLGLNLVELYEFIRSTQPKPWADLVARGYGGDEDAAELGFAKRKANNQWA